MGDLQRIIATVGFGAVVAVFVVGLALRLTGAPLHRPFWKLGLRLYAGAMAGLPVVGGIVIFTIPFWRVGENWWVALVTVPAGLFSVAVGIVGVRWIVRVRIPDNGEAGLGTAGRRRL